MVQHQDKLHIKDKLHISEPRVEQERFISKQKLAAAAAEVAAPVEQVESCNRQLVTKKFSHQEKILRIVLYKMIKLQLPLQLQWAITINKEILTPRENHNVVKW